MVNTVIRTPDQRVRVFVSSTLGELAPERLAVQEAIEELRLIPLMFELGARSHPPRELYRAYLAQSDVFLGIHWQRYGWIAPDETMSGLEDEYRLATDLPRLLYIKEPAPDRVRKVGRFGRRGSATRCDGHVQSEEPKSGTGEAPRIRTAATYRVHSPCVASHVVQMSRTSAAACR